MVILRISLFSILYVVLVLIVQDLTLVNAQHQNRRDPRIRPPINRHYYQNKTQGYYNRPHPCEQSSCYPATGNLLIGRENRLRSSSTCGLRRPTRYCIVSHLEEKKCFLCETTPETEGDSIRNHRIGNIIYPIKQGSRDETTWWQSENGKEDVQIQLDLEAEFHFTHLIIRFQTFRPAAAIVERSYDFGRTWHIYRYFAYNCAEMFPGIPTEQKNITDVVCDKRYSNVEPSKDGELIFRVLPPKMKIENPYAEHIQNLLKLTNLRINFTRLHNLGDTLLDDRHEIQEKYYYAISYMVVRGSCSCYGHASHCLPLEQETTGIPDMVHGKCECTHNTKGLNCEECEDFYNDLPWKPAFGKNTNACKKCNCNNHAVSCHFDEAVYESSGKVSGGVCDNCQHNTQGQHCEECLPFFYKDPNEDIQSPYVCRPCDCDPNGSLDSGICDSRNDPENGIEAGACHCKKNVKGRRCDMCREGYWNLDIKNEDGCQKCTCDIRGTIHNSGCNMYTGECTCKRLVTGKDCNQCVPATYGLSDDQDGCRPCNCDPGGSIDEFCDVITGQCACRPNMTGRICNMPLQNYYIPPLHNIYEAEFPEVTECVSFAPYGNCTVISYPRPIEALPIWTGPGYQRIPENTQIQFTIDQLPRTMSYDVVIRYSTESRTDWEDAHITILRPNQYDPDGACPNSHPTYETRVPFTLSQYEKSVVALRDICFEKGKTYKIQIKFERQRRDEDNPAAQILIDSIALVPRIEVTPIFTGSPLADHRRREFSQLDCNRTYYEVNYESRADHRCKELLNVVSIFVADGATNCNCNNTGSISYQCEQFGGFCQCKPNVIGRQCEQCAPGTYGFGPEGCKACDCNSIGSRSYECDLITGQCDCLPNTYGRQCDQCQPGYWNFPNCQMCQCNGHAISCDSRTGQCIDCIDHTAGDNCDRCIEGYYGDPHLGSEIGCRPCRCPDTVDSRHYHADACDLDRRTKDMICYCKEGHTGAKCDMCADNYYGNPETFNGTCQSCNCSNNIEIRDIGNCDPKSGKCLKCLHNTAGEHCEYCRDGFFGDALRQDCRPCDCELLGTDSKRKFCDRFTGKCPCLKNVEGNRCDRCIENHWKIASGHGCEPCACDLKGSLSEQCAPYDGKCRCKSGFGGRQCNQCEENFWGDPNFECYPCRCDLSGSLTKQCNRETGQCECKAGMGGYKCDQCARGYIGDAPYCSPCGECFDNWDLILSALENETMLVIERAKKVQVQGVSGAYSKDFNEIDEKLKTIQQLLDNTTTSHKDIESIGKRVRSLRDFLVVSQENLQISEARIGELESNITLSRTSLESFKNKSEKITSLSNQFKENATRLQEENTEGALSLTQQAFQDVKSLDPIREEAGNYTESAERNCRRTEAMVNRILPDFEVSLKQINESVKDLSQQLKNISASIPDLNNEVCGGRGDPCDSLCGGASCGTCGGLSCEKGAITRAENALKLAKDTENAIKNKKENADKTIRALSQTKAAQAYQKAKDAYDSAESYLNRTNNLIKIGNELVTQLVEIIDNKTASPEEIRDLAEKTLELNLQQKPEEIRALGQKINDAIRSLQDVESIIANTANDLRVVEELKQKANDTKKMAADILAMANSVILALEDADIAQEKAADAIKQANIDINLAKDDLDNIDIETKDAELPANEMARKVEQLVNRLNQLKKNAAKNEIDAKDISQQTEDVKESASNAYELGSRLKSSFKQAHDSLNEKAKTSELVRERAQQLLQRASKLTVDTTGQLKELTDMLNMYNSKESTLEGLQEVILQLNDEMDVYLKKIQSEAERFRACQ